MPFGDIRKSRGYRCSLAFRVSHSLTFAMLIIGLAATACMVRDGWIVAVGNDREDRQMIMKSSHTQSQEQDCVLGRDVKIA